MPIGEKIELKKISIITPIFRGEKYLPNLRDVIDENAKLSENIATIEWILVNDDPDSHISQVPYSENFTVIYIDTTINRGIHKARLVGLDACTGQFVHFLDQDDTISENWVVSQLMALNDEDAVVSDCIENGKSLYNTLERPTLERSVEYEYNLTRRCGFIPGQVLIKKDSISSLWKNSPLNASYCDDYYLWLCMFADGRIFKANPNAYYEHVVNGMNQSYKLGVWAESTHEMMNVFKENKLFSDSDRDTLFKAREREIEETVERLSWDGIRTDILKGLLKISCNIENDSINKLKNKNIAIYGVDIGKYVYMTLERIGIIASCYIDKKEINAVECVPVFKKENIPQNIDVIINTLLKEENKNSVRDYIGERYHNLVVIDIMELVCC